MSGAFGRDKVKSSVRDPGGRAVLVQLKRKHKCKEMECQDLNKCDKQWDAIEEETIGSKEDNHQRYIEVGHAQRRVDNSYL